MAGTIDSTDNYCPSSTADYLLLKVTAVNLIQGLSRVIETVEIVSELVNN